MSHKNTIFLDVDGVCAAWTETVQKMWMYTPPSPDNKLPYDAEQAIGISEKQMWDAIYAAGVEWWASLPVYPWAEELYASLQEVADVVFLTSPCRRGMSAMGKTLWLQKFTREKNFREYIITDRKHHCARPNSVLVDDSPVKIKNFIKKGGHGVLFPRQWNDGPVLRDDQLVEYTVEAVKMELGLTLY